MEDCVPGVVNPAVKTGRATTPQLTRNATPNKRTGSAPRSLSASKASLLRLMNETQKNPKFLSKNVSHRKQRKFENDHLFGLNFVMKKLNHQNQSIFEDHEAFSESSELHPTFAVHFQSLFNDILLPENEEARKAYLSCSILCEGQKTNKKMQCVDDCIDEWDKAGFCWTKMEKRLKIILLSTISNSFNQSFIHEMELALFSTSFETVEINYTPSEDMKNIYEAIPFFNSTGELIVNLVDIPFYRLLLHATCQFHAMHSKTLTVKGSKVTKIRPHNSQKCSHSISLVAYALHQYHENLFIKRNQGGGTEADNVDNVQ